MVMVGDDGLRASHLGGVWMAETVLARRRRRVVRRRVVERRVSRAQVVHAIEITAPHLQPSQLRGPDPCRSGIAPLLVTATSVSGRAAPKEEGRARDAMSMSMCSTVKSKRDEKRRSMSNQDPKMLVSA